MKLKALLIAFTATLTLTLAGCNTQPTYVGGSQAENKAAPLTMGIDRQDFEKAAQESVDSLLRSNALNKPQGGRYVVAISKVMNDTTQRIDTDMLIKKIRIAMLQSGKAVITSAVSANGAGDDMVYQSRELRGNDEFRASTVAKKGTLIAPDMSLSGKIMQRNAITQSGDQLAEYYFQLTLTELATGLAFWEGESVIGKMGSNDTVTW